MSISTIAPNGTKEITIPATESIAISNYGGGIAKIYYLIEDANRPPIYQFQQTIENSAVTLGAFAVETIIKIEAGNSTVIYEVAVSPGTGSGDADTLGGNPASYYAADSNVIHTTGNETKDGKMTFTSDVDITQASPNLDLQDTDDNVRLGFGISSGNIYVVCTDVNNTGSGTLYFCGASSSTDIGTFQVRHSGAWRNIYHAGLNPSLAAGTGISGTFTTADAKTVTVTNGIITSIV